MYKSRQPVLRFIAPVFSYDLCVELILLSEEIMSGAQGLLDKYVTGGGGGDGDGQDTGLLDRAKV